MRAVGLATEHAQTLTFGLFEWWFGFQRIKRAKWDPSVATIKNYNKRFPYCFVVLCFSDCKQNIVLILIIILAS